MDGKTKIIIMVVVFIVSMALIFIGQKNVGYTGLATELVGLAGLIGVIDPVCSWRHQTTPEASNQPVKCGIPRRNGPFFKKMRLARGSGNNI